MKNTTLKLIVYPIISCQIFFIFSGCNSNARQPITINLLADTLKNRVLGYDTLFLVTLANNACIPCISFYANTINNLQANNKKLMVLMPHIRKIEKDDFLKKYKITFNATAVLIESNSLYQFYLNESKFETDVNGLYVYVKDSLIYKTELKRSNYPI